MLLWLAIGCGGSAVLPSLAPPEAEVEVRALTQKVAEGESVMIAVSVWSGAGWNITAGAPTAEGLNTKLVETADPITSGTRQVQTWTYALSGDNGSYVVTTGEGHGTGPGGQERTFEPAPVFVDIGVKGPSGGAMDGFADGPPPVDPPWGWVAVLSSILVGLVALFVALIVWWRRPRRVPIVPPVPPDLAATRAWSAAKEDHAAQKLDDPGLALALSQILRRYIEATFGWPVTKRTTREILRLLEGSGADSRSLGMADRMRTARILDATDRLKFAREGGGADFFTALGQDFVAVIDATTTAPSIGESDA
jgi:hypothetical protein